jgi:hypothetical protein
MDFVFTGRQTTVLLVDLFAFFLFAVGFIDALRGFPRLSNEGKSG